MSEGRDAGGLALQRELLARVSRTFALTIPALPDRLERVVGNAYLLCRIADTIEDASSLEPRGGFEFFCERFVAVVAGRGDAAAFARDFAPRLAPEATADERRLIAETPRVLAVTAGFEPAERAALAECVDVMAHGMAEFHRTRSVDGLADLAEHSRYCYVVAGCVGEMLTRLFLIQVPEIASRRDELMRLAVSFGQCLQMTNILKDFWEDRSRGACWLPRDVFVAEGVDLARVAPGDPRLARGFRGLVAVAQGHARRALDFVLAIPRRESGIRNFCLWALFMAVLTQRKLLARPGFASGAEVKIRRSTVRLVVAGCRLGARSDAALRASFALASRGLPRAPAELVAANSSASGREGARVSS